MSNCDLREIVRTLELFVEPHGVGELRAIGCGDRKLTVSIYFAGDELEEIAPQAAEISATSTPASSRASRTAVTWGVSPGSTNPLGSCHRRCGPTDMIAISICPPVPSRRNTTPPDEV